MPTEPAPSSRGGVAGRILYGFLFAAVVPAALVLWAHATRSVIRLPALHLPGVGLALAGAGVVVILAGMLGLARHGRGLPMNAYPPPRYVDRGIYRFLANPIYVGFGLSVLGVAICAGSASGLWLVTPATWLGMAALVLGHERLDLRRRFGEKVHPARISLPRGEDRRPTGWERVSVYLLVLLPWAVAYEAVQLMGRPPGSVNAHLAFEAHLPVWPWTEAIYASAYVLVLLTPLVVPTAKALRRLSVAALWATAVVTFVYLVVPLVSPPRPFVATTTLGHVLAAERAFNNTVAAFPSFHVFWVFLAAAAWPKRARPVVFLWATLISLACITTGMHAVVDVVAGAAIVPLFHRYDLVWARLRGFAEWVANSWTEWRLGPVRFLSRALFIGLGALVGGAFTALALGPRYLPGMLIVGVCALLGAAAWAQWLEGSSMLLRPFGFYGGLLGGIAGTFIAWALGYPPMILLAAYGVGLPFVQGFGRLGCLVNGCCHGARTTPTLGIRYRHSRSRVTHIAGLVDVPLYPTQLYSFLVNLFLGVAMIRLWLVHAPATLMVGLYFLVAGLARFIEESYRDEPQTAIVWGLHVYHWLALASIVGGAIVTALPVHEALATHAPTLAMAGCAVGLAVFGLFLMGVDFPESNRRFSRLAPADGEPRLLEAPTASEPPRAPSDRSPRRAASGRST